MKAKKIKVSFVEPGDDPLQVWSKKCIKDWKLMEAGKIDQKEEVFDLILSHVDDLVKIFSPTRVLLMQAIRDKKPRSIAALAKILSRKQADVLADVKDLKELGVVEFKKARKKAKGDDAFYPSCKWNEFFMEM